MLNRQYIHVIKSEEMGVTRHIPMSVGDTKDIDLGSDAEFNSKPFCFSHPLTVAHRIVPFTFTLYH